MSTLKQARASRAPHVFALGVFLRGICPVFAGNLDLSVENDWFRGWPPAEVTYAFGSRVRDEGTDLGDLDTLYIHAAYVASIGATDSFNWLLGIDWKRVQASVPADTPIPNTLQSAAAVLGFDWQFATRWHARLEVAPGIYSDFQDISGDDLNAPFTPELSYSINSNLLIGVQMSVDLRRDLPAVAFPNVRWKFAERWLLSLRIPRPQLEFAATEHLSVIAGASLAGGSYVVAEDFGRRHGRSQLDGQSVDFEQVGVGLGVRYATERVIAEIGAGWIVDRRYNFHERDVELKTDGAPYVQVSFATTF
jgi:hypothetical protein